MKKLLMGNEAMAYAALQAGVNVVAGYPGTPSSEIVETAARLRADGTAHDVHVEWSTNEKAALEVLFGASLAGARGLFTCKQMGLNVASDALMSLNYVSVRGGLVLVVADDPGPISSQTEQDTRRFAAFAKVPVLDPSTPEQAYAMITAAFDLSEQFHTPVIVRPTTRVDHASAFFEVPDQTFARPIPEGGFSRDTSKWVIFPRRAYQAHGEINERLPQIAHLFATQPEFSAFNKVEGDLSAKVGIVAGGISAAYAREALRMVQERVDAAGLDMPSYRFMQVGTPYPFPEEAIAAFAEGLQEVLVLEELDYVLEDALAMWVGRNRVPLRVRGKLTGDARDRGENDVDDVVARIERFLGLSGRLRLRRRERGVPAHAVVKEEVIDGLPARPPVLCPGCPHRGAFYAVKQALRGVPAIMCGDIGCYTLGNAMPLDAVDTCLCMGAGITMAQGLAITDPDKKAIAFVGDSTFFASGMTGLANAAYNGHDITVMVLDNATTAMTGSQPHPGTGVTLMGQRNKPLDIEAVLVANGFCRVYHANPLEKDSSIVAVKAAVSFQGPTAVIFESPCIQLAKPSTPVVVNPEVCTGCKKCITEIGCPAIGFNKSLAGMRSGKRGQAYIDDALCNGCDLCTQVCPFKAITVPLDSRASEGIPKPVAIGLSPALLERDPATVGSQLPAVLMPRDAMEEPAVEAAAAVPANEVSPGEDETEKAQQPETQAPDTVEPAAEASASTGDAEGAKLPAIELPKVNTVVDAALDGKVPTDGPSEDEPFAEDGVDLKPVTPGAFATVLLKPVREAVEFVEKSDEESEFEPDEESVVEFEEFEELEEEPAEDSDEEPENAPHPAQARSDAALNAAETVAIDPVNADRLAAVNQLREKILGYSGEAAIDPAVFTQVEKPWNSWSVGNWADVPFEGDEDD